MTEYLLVLVFMLGNSFSVTTVSGISDSAECARLALALPAPAEGWRISYHCEAYTGSAQPIPPPPTTNYLIAK